MRPIRRRALLAGVVLAAAAMLAGAGSAVPWVSTGRPNGPSGVDGAVLDGWRDFPVGQRPRPIVLIGRPLREEGYRTADAKLAAQTGRIELAAPLPDGPPSATVALPDGLHPLRLAPAGAAWDGVRASGAPDSGGAPPPLRITEVRLGMATFGTDRGRIQLPAWLFDSADLLAPLAWPAVHPEAFWHLGAVDYPMSLAENTVSADGRTILATMRAAPPACPGRPVVQYVAEVRESKTAVAIGLRAVPTGEVAPGSSTVCGIPLILRTAVYRVMLRSPLGNRVLVDTTGAPMVVGVR